MLHTSTPPTRLGITFDCPTKVKEIRKKYNHRVFKEVFLSELFRHEGYVARSGYVYIIPFCAYVKPIIHLTYESSLHTS